MGRSLRTPGAEEVLASIRDAFFAVDRDWRFTYLNGEAERLLARPADELLGRCVWDEFPEATDRAFFREYQEAMREQRTVSFVEFFPPLDTWFSVKAYPHPDGLSVYFQNVNAQKRAERQIAGLAAEQAALRRVATEVAAGLSPAELFRLAAREAAELLGGEAGAVLKAVDHRRAVIGGIWSAGRARLAEGALVPTGGDLDRVLQSGRPMRVDRCGERGTGEGALLGFSCALLVPICVGARPWGVLGVVAGRGEAFASDAEERLADFGALVALAVANTEDRQKLAEQATTDPLTGLLNHRCFHERLRTEVARAQRHRRSLAVAVLDVDFFKHVNDGRGHRAGDELLKVVADALRREVRSEDVLARVGGDEFAMLMPETDRVDAYAVVDRARRAASRAAADGVGRATLSAGVCDLATAVDAPSLYGLADGALYWSKAHGRDVTWIYDSAVVQELSAQQRADHLQRSQALLGIRALARAIDAKDPATREHSEEVAALAAELALELGWEPTAVSRLHEAGLVHDVGKIGIPDAVLLKPGRLTDQEYDQIKEHAALGAQIAEDVLDPEQVGWIRGHHERPDGRGYPGGVTADEIPVGAALLALADAFDVMTRDRRYSPRRSAADALAECRRLSGAQFTVQAVDALDAVLATHDIDHAGAT